MNAAVDSTAIELRRGASSTLKSADRPSRGLGEYSNHNSSDISGVYCESELHSPMSMDSSASSEKIMSPSGSPRNHSDISEGCPSPLDKDEGFLEPDMIPSGDSPRTSPSVISNKHSVGNNADIEEDEVAEPSDFNGSKRKSKADNVDDDDRLGVKTDSDQKQMVDIVGGASSPGEFFDHALEFINGSEKENRNQWASSDLRRSRLRDEETDMPRSKRVKTSGAYDDDFPMYQSQTKSNLRQKSTYNKNDSNRIHPYGRYDVKAKPLHNPQRREHRASPQHSLSPDQKLFVEAFKKEVTMAAEQVAEASALRVLEILDGQGIGFSRYSAKSRYERSSVSDDTAKYPTGKLRPTHTSSPILDRRRDSEDLHMHEDAMIPPTKERYTSDKEGLPSSTPIRSHERFEDNRIDKESRRRHPSTDAIKRDLSIEKNRKMDTVDNSKEQTQALSLVTTPNRAARSPTIDSDSSAVCSKTPRQPEKSPSPPDHEGSVRPFVRSPLGPSKNQHKYVPPFSGYGTSSSSSSFKQVDYYSANSMNKFLRDGANAELSDRRKHGMSETLSSDKAMDYSNYPLASPNSSKSKNIMKSRAADSYKDENKRSVNLPEEKTQSDMIMPSSLALHGVPNGSAFRKHQTRRSPVSGGMRSLRSNGSPESKPFPPPGPFSMMYNPFANLPFPLGVPQPPHLAAASLLAAFNQRQNQNDYRNIRSGQTTLAPERIPVHPSLRGHSNGSYLGDHHGYEVDPSSYAFPNNIQEGLTPQHLKKAKLMFFYTRYPNANTLKTYFPDVKFTRAITSQLIKWFSNFREFFYIQMEKFARQAITDGVHDASMLRVTRECELFRVLNLHYNKCNEFRVPSAFLNAAEASQREFFNAVKAGKDSDPAWKKVIYKVICKLDSEIPELFKSPNVLDRLHDIRDQ